MHAAIDIEQGPAADPRQLCLALAFPRPAARARKTASPLARSAVALEARPGVRDQAVASYLRRHEPRLTRWVREFGGRRSGAVREELVQVALMAVVEVVAGADADDRLNEVRNAMERHGRAEKAWDRRLVPYEEGVTEAIINRWGNRRAPTGIDADEDDCAGATFAARLHCDSKEHRESYPPGAVKHSVVRLVPLARERVKGGAAA